MERIFRRLFPVWQQDRLPQVVARRKLMVGKLAHIAAKSVQHIRVVLFQHRAAPPRKIGERHINISAGKHPPRPSAGV